MSQALAPLPERSYRPLGLRIADLVVRGLDRVLGRVLMPDAERLIAAARRKTGLTDFGDDPTQPLQVLCDGVRNGPPLSAFARGSVLDELKTRLSNRLQIEAYAQANPEVRDDPVPAPIFIIGLPRTGTTFLQRLLAADPRNRSPRSWEMQHPIPPPQASTYESDRRIFGSAYRTRAIEYVAPTFKAIHHYDARLPEECMALLANAMMSMWFTLIIDTPYSDWLERQDLTRAYALHRLQLQILQSHHRLDRWVLKAPWHLHGLRWLLKVYPDARVIHTHRDPLEVLPSMSSLLAALRAISYRTVDLRAIGEEVADMTSRWLEQALAARAAEEARPDTRAHFLDLHYRDFVTDPMAEVERIYTSFDIELAPRSERAMRSYMEDNPKHKHGVHRYSLDRFGFDADAERERFSAYREYLGLGG